MTKGLKNFLVILVTLIIVAGLCVGAFYIGKKVTKEPETQSEEEGQESGLVSPGEVEMNGIKITAATLSAPMYEAYGAPRGAEAALTLTVTPTPADAELTGAKFTMAFKNASSAWATGKTVTEYVTLSQSNERSATVSCLKAFGEPIVITYTVKGENDANKTATYQLDYRARIAKGNVRFGGVYFEIAKKDLGYALIDNESDKIELLFTYSDYTVKDTFTADETTFKFTETFKAACQSAGVTLPEITPGKIKTFTFPADSSNTKGIYFELPYASGSGAPVELLFGKTAYKTNAFRDVVTAQNDTGIFELTVKATDGHTTFSKSANLGINLSGFPKAVQSVQFSDGSQHTF